MISKDRKDAIRFKKYLKTLTQTVRQCLDALDLVMKGPSTVERGKKIAKICNTLEMANDHARHFGLNEKL